MTRKQKIDKGVRLEEEKGVRGKEGGRRGENN